MRLLPEIPVKNLYRLRFILKPYRVKLFWGVMFTFLFTIFNGFTFGAIIPVIDTLTPGGKKFQFELTIAEKKILSEEVPLSSITRYISKQSAGLKNWINLTIQSFSKKDQLLFVSLGILPLFFFRSIFSVAAIYLMRKLGLFAVRDLRTRLYAHLQKLSLDFFHGERIGDLMQRMTRDIDNLAELVSQQLQLLIQHVLTIIIFLAAILYISWEMSLFALIAIPIMVTPIAIFTDRMRRASNAQLIKASDLTSYIQEKFNGVRIIRAFGREDYEQKNFDYFAHDTAKSELKKHFYGAISPAMVEFFAAVASAMLFFYGGLTILDGKMSTGEFIFFLIALLSLITPIQQLARMSSYFYHGDAVAKRVLEILDREPRIKDPVQPAVHGRIHHGIQFENITFRYDRSTEDVLKNIDFFVPVGKTVALVGPSGGGKSTIIDMVARFYDPLTGSIKIDNIDIRNFSLKWLRSKIAIVTQEIFLFGGTIKSNIAYGKMDATDAEIEAAARAANAHDFIMEMPQGYDTMIGERGVMLSGGQRQRVSIARAILSDPEIMLLDEATSALDTESERLVQEALNHLLKGRTSLVVAHRLSTIHGADEIVVIDKGEMVQRGKHDDLVKQEGLYKKLHNMQFQL